MRSIDDSRRTVRDQIRQTANLANPKRPCTVKDLDVWKLGVELAVAVDELAEKLIRDRRFAMANQITGAVLSVPSNIAEGNGRAHRLEYARHVSISRGSLLEVESILYVAIRCGHLGTEACAKSFDLIDRISRMLTRLLRALYRPVDKAR